MSSDHSSHPKLGQAAATAICGNDILSSALYVSGIAALFAGIYAPLILLGIGIVLFLYKKVYTEVVEALPVNGGAYNCLLNGTSKTVAAIAGVMTFLSYIATAVISAKVGVEYLGKAVEKASEHFDHFVEMPVMGVTVVVLFLFALLVIAGVKDSAKVALGIFVTHVLTLALFVGVGAYYWLNGGASHLADNWQATSGIVAGNGGIPMTLYLAFSASLLGVSGFESSANFVEEQDKGVFRKTLRNMLLGVTFFNPLISLVTLYAMPYAAITSAKDFLLADAAQVIGGSWLQYVVSVDAFLVLCGAVLTAYVGVSGLLHRMAADGCIPHWFAKENRRGSFPRIILTFFVLCSSILLITQGDLLSLAGVYTIAFLGVMSLFALGNLILKSEREELKRTYRAPIAAVILALLATIFGMFGNIRIDPDNLRFFEIYFIPCLFLVLGVIYQDYVLIGALRATRAFPPLHRLLTRKFEYLRQGKFIAFIHHVSRLQPILDYINRNEVGRNVTLVHCNAPDGGKEEGSLEEIRQALPHLHKAGFYRNFGIDLVYRDLPFGPKAITTVAKEMKVPRNRVFIGSIHHFHAFDYAELGGVRIIFG